jgi:hypothetical protein
LGGSPGIGGGLAGVGEDAVLAVDELEVRATLGEAELAGVMPSPVGWMREVGGPGSGAPRGSTAVVILTRANTTPDRPGARVTTGTGAMSSGSCASRTKIQRWPSAAEGPRTRARRGAARRRRRSGAHGGPCPRWRRRRGRRRPSGGRRSGPGPRAAPTAGIDPARPPCGRASRLRVGCARAHLSARQCATLGAWGSENRR